MFDCAEGTQRQMSLVGISRSKVDTILISHWHGDHVAGLVGLFQTIGNKEDNPTINLYGPVGSKEYIKHLLKSCYFDVQINLKVHELKPKKVDVFYSNDDYELHACLLDHSIPCLGFAFVEKDRRNIDVDYLKKNKIKEGRHLEVLKQGKDVTVDGKKIKYKEATYVIEGKKVAYVMDTAFCTNAVKLAKSVDLLFCESTYHSSHELKAEDYKHLTAKQAAQIASQADVKQLVLTHFSQRYKDVSELLEEAKDIFPNTKAAFDLMKITL